MHPLRSMVRALVPATVLGAGVLTAACSDASGPRNGSANLTVSVATLSSTSIAQLVGARAIAPSFDRQVTIPGGTHVLVITRAAVLLSRIELETTDAATCPSGDGGSDGRVVSADQGGSEAPAGSDVRCEELATGPMLVELPVDNSVVSMLSLQIPAGTYRSLEAKIHAVQASDPGGAAFLSAHPEFTDASVRVEGTFDGRPFVYVGSSHAQLELQFDPPLIVGAAPTNLTVHVSIDRWFTDRNGQLIDPATAISGGANASLVADNIRRSFHAFEDRDRHGDDGHGDDGFGGPDNQGGDH